MAGKLKYRSGGRLRERPTRTLEDFRSKMEGESFPGRVKSKERMPDLKMYWFDTHEGKWKPRKKARKLRYERA